MFNLLFSRDPEAWESTTCRMQASRFGEHGERLPLDDEATFRLLEQLPTLLAYESTTIGASAHLVRHGLIGNLHRAGADLIFDFIIDPEQGYLSRSVLRDHADQLEMHRNEPYRTHWAVKADDLPETLLAEAGPTPPLRNVPRAYSAYRKAVRSGKRKRSEALTEEIAQFPPSEDKGIEYLRTRQAESVCTPAAPLLGVLPKTPEARELIERVTKGQPVVLDPYPDVGHGSSPFLLAPFYSCYGGPTEVGRFEEAIEQAIAVASELESGYRMRQAGLRSIAYVLWRAGQSPTLAKHLRRRLAGLVDRMMLDRTSRATWANSDGKSDLLATGMIVVGMQRLGDDKHRTAVCETVRSLCQKQLDTGGLPATAGNRKGDVLATCLLLEAVQRSGYAAELSHILERGEAWSMAQQRSSGALESPGWPAASVTASVLGYFQSRTSMLPQVDGFFLMARDFFKKAMDLKAEKGANNRRIAAITTVHAVEMFLYGLFERVPELGVSAYREKGDETLGPRAALSELQVALRRTGALAGDRALSHRDQISGLVRQRDSIIHHATEISEEELGRGLKAARRFISQYGADLTGLDILQ